MTETRSSGTPNSFSIDGIPFGCMADADIASTLSKWTIEVMMTSGQPMVQYTLVNRKKSGFNLSVTGDERARLTDMADEKVYRKFVYVDNAGNAYHCEGLFMMEDQMSAKNTVNVQVFPITSNKWERIAP